MSNDKNKYNFLYSIVEEVMEDLDLETDRYTVDEQVRKAAGDENLYSEIYNNIFDFIKGENNLE